MLVSNRWRAAILFYTTGKEDHQSTPQNLWMIRPLLHYDGRENASPDRRAVRLSGNMSCPLFCLLACLLEFL